MRKAKVATILVLILAVAGWMVADMLLPHALVVPYRVHLDKAENPQRYGVPFNAFDVVTYDNITLKGWFIPALTDKPAGTIVLLHGWGSCKEHMIPVVRLLAVHGYNCIAYDARAHGESGGKYCTFGFKEKRDVAVYIREAEMRYGHLGPIGILGISGGGATAIATLADDTSIKCGIIISTFSSLEEAARDELKRAIHFQSSFLLQRGLQVGAKNAGFNYTDINSVELAKKISQPVLVIHGENDGRFPLKMGRRIYDSLPSPGKEWFVAKHSDHDGILWRGDVVNMNRKILTFLAKQMDRK